MVGVWARQGQSDLNRDPRCCLTFISPGSVVYPHSMFSIAMVVNVCLVPAALFIH